MNDLPFEWEAGEIIEQAYVEIGGVKYYVTPAQYAYGTSLSAYHLNKSEYETIKRVNGTILWENPNPTADFSSQQIILSSSDYDVLEFYWRSDISTTDGAQADVVRALKGYGAQFEYCSTFSTNKWVRRIVRLDDTTFGVWDCLGIHDGQNHNEFDVPLYVVGYKTGLFGGQS